MQRLSVNITTYFLVVCFVLFSTNVLAYRGVQTDFNDGVNTPIDTGISSRLPGALCLANIEDKTGNTYMADIFMSTDQSLNLAQDTPPSYKPGLDYGKWHRYLGYSTILLAGVAAVSSSTKGLHYGSAYLAAGTAVATCYTGYYEYAEYFEPELGLTTPANLHIILGAIGTLAFVTTVAFADSGNKSSHATLGVTGGLAMTASVISIKW